MKKLIAFFMIFMSMTVSASANEDIKVYLNNEELTFDVAPIIRNDSTLVPFRAIFEKLDMTVQWFEDEKRVTAQKNDTVITLFIDNTEMDVNSEKITLLTPPIIHNDRTLVPLRAVSEAAGATVDWNGETRTVYITAEESSFDDWSKQILELTNAEREKNGLDPLEWDDSLAELAQSHCNDMIEREYFAHNTPDGKTPFDRMREAGILYWSAGENIAAGQYSPEAAFEAWMNSEGHKKNILNKDFEHMGVSVVKGGKYGIYWAQEFARFR
ncbi:MAG: hypothetical protein IJX57_03410 [Clostridia bacterium]|nr:hypothetical protein [Clostridia bacterium]